jgi:hypothetical protein
VAWPKGKPRGLYVRGTPADRWWARVNKNGPVMPGMSTACWEWTGARNRKGYGTFAPDHAGNRLAHTVGWELANGPIPNDLEVCHHCDNRGCVNFAEHLYLGTHRQNIDDAIRRGRLVGRYAPRGDKHYATKVSEVDAEVLRLLYALGAGSQNLVGDAMGVPRKLAQDIISGRKRAYLAAPLLVDFTPRKPTRYYARAAQHPSPPATLTGADDER